jgi:hypothetical protein
MWYNKVDSADDLNRRIQDAALSGQSEEGWVPIPYDGGFLRAAVAREETRERSKWLVAFAS